MDRPTRRCSFCGKKQGDVRLIAGPSDVYICNLCVALCTEILAHDTLPNEPKPPVPEAQRTDAEPSATDSPAGSWVRTITSS